MPNKITNIENVKKLRKNSTPMEIKLWHYLRSHRFMELKFRRQHALGKYIVDFICIEKKLIIEVDGGQHNEQKNYDAIRTEFLNVLGYKVLRFWNHEVLNQFEAVKVQIYNSVFGIN